MSNLYYITFKYVVIRDTRIGVAYYAMLAGVVLYACSEIFLNKGYLEVSHFLNRTLPVVLDTA